MYSLRTITPPTVEPVTLDLFRDHLRLDNNDEDNVLKVYLSGARASLEKLCRRAFMPQTLQFSLDRFPWSGYDFHNRSSSYQPSTSVPGFVDRTTIRLPRPACLSVRSIGYLNPGLESVTLDASSYFVDLDAEPARITPQNGFWWPFDSYFVPGSIKVSYDAGTYAYPTSEQTQATSVNGAACTIPLQQTYAGGVIVLTQSLEGNETPVLFTLIGGGTSLQLQDTSLNGVTLNLTYYALRVPENVQVATLLLGAHYYRNREAASDTLMKEIPQGIQNLISDEICYAGVYEV